MVRVVISGYYGFDNLGDEAVLAGCIQGLRKNRDDLDITVLSNDPQTTEHRYNVNSIQRNDFRRLIKVLKNSDLFLSGGGSLLQDIVGWKSIPYYLGQVLLARFMGNKTAFYAQGIGPVNNNINKKLIKYVANRCNLITLRDQNSCKLLESIGVNSKLIGVYADPVFILQPELKSSYFKGEETVIGVAARPWATDNYLEPLIEGIEQIAKELEARVIIIPFHYHQDCEISRLLKERLSLKVSVLEGKFTPEEMINIFSSLDFCIGVRLHSLMFAALSRIPFVGISYDPKVTAFLEGLDIYSGLNINNLSSHELIKQSRKVWQNKNNFIFNIDKKVKNYRRLALENTHKILELV